MRDEQGVFERVDGEKYRLRYRDHQLSNSHYKTRFLFANTWIKHLEETFTPAEREIAVAYKASFVTMRAAKKAHERSGLGRSSDEYKAYASAKAENERLEADPVFLDRGRSKAMMWWAIAMNKYSPPVWFDGCTGTKETYSRTIAQSFCIGGKPLTSIFMQDHASAHNDVLDSPALANFKKLITIMEWPPRSPDLNPIENLWQWLDRKKRAKQYKLYDVAHMKAWFAKFFEQNHAEIVKKINKCVGSFYRRLVCVSQTNGALAPY